ncbi:N-acetylmuramoyl-L-alanine amidase [Bacillus sp. M6-12]|uniref:N-acetylmuramoyl-L-alanine amidase family protein n=1 Tax=Bacillus sp. M6-12 TaxID=2054166 RepID=UPI000C75A9F0|nr:N-acetylmuramoyl-L-alanine amidase [Bacillus sp. M6-12]PLS15744.1 N-acetylmuramoyl-L-alanine amidase [Bacillus sp. M6-12]
MKKIIFFLITFLLAFSQLGVNTGKAVMPQKTICIDAGHQAKQNLGKEPISPGSKILKTKVSSGTQGIATKKPEYKLNLEVSLKLRDALQKNGYKVYMVRTSHNVNISNVQRANYCNKSKANLSIRIHADGSTNKSVQGLTVLYPTGKSTTKVNKTSKKAAEYVLYDLIKTTKAKKGYGTGLMPRSDLTGFNWSTTPVILVEMGFMSNAAEDRKLSAASYQNQLVYGMTSGIERYFR